MTDLNELKRLADAAGCGYSKVAVDEYFAAMHWSVTRALIARLEDAERQAAIYAHVRDVLAAHGYDSIASPLVALDKAQECIRECQRAMEAALANHNRVLVSLPPKDGWVHHQVDERLADAIRAAQIELAKATT